MKKIFFLFATLAITVSAFAQDIIITNASKKIVGKVIEVTQTEIKYKTIDNLDGPTYVLAIREINTILYENGKVEIFNQQIEEDATVVQESEEAIALRRAREEAERKRQQAEAEERRRQREEQARLEEERRAREAAEAERRAKEAEAIARAQGMGSLFGQTGNTSGSGDGQGNGQKGNPIGHGSSGSANWSLSGRDLKGALPQPSNNFRQAGTVIVEIHVNATGNVISATHKGGTVSDSQTIQIAIDAAKKAKFSRGSGDQIGTITYIFKIN